MLLLREKVQVTLMFLGIFCCIFGLVLFDPFQKEEKLTLPQVHKSGVWKDGGITKEARREFAPWVFGIGVAAFFGAYFSKADS